MKIYGIKTCDSVRKAIKFCKTHALEYELIDFKQTPVKEEHIQTWLKQVELSKLFNTRGTTYRTLKLKELNLDDTQKINWLAKENLLIKRPVIEYEESVTVGFNEDEYKQKFLK